MRDDNTQETLSILEEEIKSKEKWIQNNTQRQNLNKQSIDFAEKSISKLKIAYKNVENNKLNNFFSTVKNDFEELVKADPEMNEIIIQIELKHQVKERKIGIIKIQHNG